MARLLYLDTNVFIAAFEEHGPAAERVCALFSRLDELGPPLAVTSELSLAEVLVRPFRRQDAQLVGFYQALLRSAGQLEVRSVDRAVLLEAPRLRGCYLTPKLPDAIHLATAMIAGCDALVSDDRRLDAVTTTIARIGIAELDPLTLS